MRLTMKYTADETEMRLLRRITEKTLLYRERSGNIRRTYYCENFNKWVLCRNRNKTSTSVEWLTEH